MLLSLFCGAGGLDLGFEQAGFEVALAFDIRPDSVNSYNHNRPKSTTTGHTYDIRELTVAKLDKLHGKPFYPAGIIGGPPCQGFSRANKSQFDDDPRNELPFIYANLIIALNKRKPVPFFAFENVTGILEDPHRKTFAKLKKQLEKADFIVSEVILNASHYGVPQNRYRVIMVGLNKHIFGENQWLPPTPIKASPEKLTVRHAFKGLPEPTYFNRALTPTQIPFHPNHWCMQPKSKKFSTPGALKSGVRSNRSFKALSWDEPSITVAYGNREVHIHPNCHRRLSVYEAMLLQGFPKKYQLTGNLSSQITQISEAVPPPLAKAIAESIRKIS